MFSAGKTVEVSFEKEDYRDAWFPATVLEGDHGSFLVEYLRQGVDDNEAVLHQVIVDYLHIRPSPPHLRDGSFDLLEKVDAFYEFGWWSGVITKELADSRYIVFFKHTNKEKELNYSELRPHMDWKGGKWFSSSQRSKLGKGGEPKNQLITPAKMPGRPPRSPWGVIHGESAEDIVNIPVVIGLESKGVTNARAKNSHLLDSPKSSVKQISGQKKQLADSQTPASVKDKEVNSPEWGTVNTQKRKRRRPPTVLAQTPKISAAVNKQNGDAAPNLVVVEDYLKKQVGLSNLLGTDSVEKEAPIPDKEHLKFVGGNASKQKNTLSSVMKTSFSKKDKLLKEKSAQASGEQPKKQSSVGGKRGRRRAISVNTECSNQEKADERLEKDDMGVDALGSRMSDDEPLSMWFEGMHVDIPGGCVGVRSKEKERVVEGGDIQRLPFVKKSPLWETIGSMEVLRMIPQRPHFRALDGHKESWREGLAIGSMVTFASVVEKTTGMQFEDDAKGSIEEKLEALEELENHGFNVGVVRDRLKGLVAYKRKHEELEEERNGVRRRIGEHGEERSKVDEEIKEREREIRELEEKREVALTRKEMKKAEIACLEKQVQGMNEGIRNEFQELASSPWHPNPK